VTQFPTLALIATFSALSLAACSRGNEAPVDDTTISEGLAGEGSLAQNATGNDATTGDQVSTAQRFGLSGADGTALGSVTVSEGTNGATLRIQASGLNVGKHGVHLHEKGLCGGPKFESAGAHWNPAAKKHGRDNPDGAHLGDLANLDVGGNGGATVSFEVEGVKMTNGANLLADADGTALVVHAKPDDYKTDPSGASGDRIACAVIAPPK